jgi:hypothetical protein
MRWIEVRGGTTQQFLCEIEDKPGLHLPGLHLVDRGIDVLELAPLVDHFGLPSASSSKIACRSVLVPTIEPSTFVPFSTVSKMGGSLM